MSIIITEYSSQYTTATFQALVEAIIPYTPELSFKYGDYMAPGAAFQGIDQFVIWEFDHLVAIEINFNVHPVLLSGAIAQLLNAAASQLIHSGIIREPRKDYFPGGGEFCSLSRNGRLLTLSYLERRQINHRDLPQPFQNNPHWIQIVIDLANRYTVFGYYSEWSGYGSTRLFTPEARKLEYYPISWKQISYPAPASTNNNYIIVHSTLLI